MSVIKSEIDVKKLCTKNLLNLTESRYYLNISRRLFDELEMFDPTFPQRKTPTKHSRALLDKWLEQNDSPYFKKPQYKILHSRALRASVELQSMN